MLSKRDNLLIRPWQQRRFQNHRRKVQSALPAIDSRPPAHRGHVCYKLKKKQSERERCIQIERDNLILLQKMEAIMKKKRLDNKWEKPQPTFLHRVKMYETETPEICPKAESTYFGEICITSVPISPRESIKSLVGAPKSRKKSCTGCHPSKIPFIELDKRLLPWEEDLPKFNNTSKKSSSAGSVRSTTSTAKHKKPFELSPSATTTRNIVNPDKTPSLVLTRGNLRIKLNFPPDMDVTFKNGTVEKTIMKDLCKCKNNFAKQY